MDFQLLFKKEIELLQKELLLFKNDESLWINDLNVPNKPGTLFLHIVGNIKHFIGVGLGNSKFKRDRDFEFTQRDVSTESIYDMLGECIDVIDESFENNKFNLEENFSLPIGDKNNLNILEAFIILLNHVNYHRGQINYYRRLLGE